jgi:hypothetical protein
MRATTMLRSERAEASATSAAGLRVCPHCLELFADLLVNFEILGDAAVDADALALVEVRLSVTGANALCVTCPAQTCQSYGNQSR